MPTPTDLVTDLPADFEVFGQAVDSTMADLKGGTSGQILSKNSNTDMDFIWIANDQGDITGVTATSPLTGGGTSGAITVGIQTASTSQSGAVQLTDSTSSTSTTTAATPNAVKSAYDLAASAYAPAFTNNFFAGKNKVINGDFRVWQRGTSFSLTGSTIYTADRWATYGVTGDTLSQQTFTPGTAPVSGYEGTFYARLVTGATASPRYFYQKIEDVRTFAGQTVTLSFWARVSAGTGTIDATLGNQNFGSGGSAFVGGTGQSFTATTSWQRFSFSGTVASVAGKTIGFGSFAEATLSTSNTSKTFEFWGVQLEAGSVPTPFQTATGTIQGEWQACKYYYRRLSALVSNPYSYFMQGTTNTTTQVRALYQLDGGMRTNPSISKNGNWAVGPVGASVTSISIDQTTWSGSSTNAQANAFNAQINVASGLTVGQSNYIYANNDSTAYLEISAEL